MSARHPCYRTRHLTDGTVTDSTAPVRPARLELLSAAVELGVDREEITFESPEERRLWEDLEQEFQAFVTKIGPVWIAD